MRIKGYTKSDGTRVKGYTRDEPQRTRKGVKKGRPLTGARKHASPKTAEHQRKWKAVLKSAGF